MYLMEIGAVLQKRLRGSEQALKGLHCEAGVTVSLGSIGSNLHLTST